MVADAAAKAHAYRVHRAAAARAVRFVHVPDGSAPPAEAFAVKRVSFIRHGQGEHNLHDELWKAAGKPGNPYGPGPCYSRSCSYHSRKVAAGGGGGVSPSLLAGACCVRAPRCSRCVDGH